MLVAMMLVNIFNFAYNMVMARMLGPGSIWNIDAVVTLLLLASWISLAFQLVCAKFVARNHATQQGRCSPQSAWQSLDRQPWFGRCTFSRSKASCNLSERAQPVDHRIAGALVLRRMRRWA